LNNVDPLLEKLPNHASSPQPTIPPIQNAIHVPESAPRDADRAPRPESHRDACQVPVPGQRGDLEVQEFRPHAGDSVHERSTIVRDGPDDVCTQRLATVVHEQSPIQDNLLEVGTSGMTWLLGDDGLSSSTSGELLCTVTTPEPWMESTAMCSGDPVERFDARGTQFPPDDEVLAELIGSSSPLANLPMETDVDALIELLRTSPASSKPISHSSTFSLNDILDDNPNLETTVDLDPSLRNLVDRSYGFDEERTGDRRGAEIALETVPGSHTEEPSTFRNTYRHGFGFGSEAFGRDRIGEDVARQATVPNDGRNKEGMQSVKETFKSEFSETENSPHMFLDSTVDSRNLPADRQVSNSGQDLHLQDNASHSDLEIKEDLIDASTGCTLSHVPPQLSAGVVENQERVENSVNDDAVEAHRFPSKLTGADSGDGGQFLDSSCQPVEEADHSIEDVLSQTKSDEPSRQNEPDNNKSGKFAATDMCGDDAAQKLSDNSEEKPYMLKQAEHSKVTALQPPSAKNIQGERDRRYGLLLSRHSDDEGPNVRPIVRRKSFELGTSQEEVKSRAEVGKDNVTWLTAYFEGVHADQCPGCQICLSGTVQRPFVIQRRSSLPVGTGAAFTPPEELVAKRVGLPSAKQPIPLPVVDAASASGRSKETSAPSETGPGRTLNFLPVSSAQTQASSPKEPKPHKSGLRNSLSNVTEGKPDPACQREDGFGSAASRRVVSLPDVSGGSTSRKREGQRRAEFRFRVAKVHSHSLRSFSDLTACGVATKRSAANQPPFHHPRSSADQSIHKAIITADKKFSDSKSAETGQILSERLGERVKSAEEVGPVGAARKAKTTVSLDNLLAQLCSTTNNTEKEGGSPLTPDRIRMYRIEPRKKVPAPPTPLQRGGGSRTSGLRRQENSQVQARRRTDDEALRQKYGGLEKRIDDMLFNIDPRRSDEEWQRPTRRNVPRTTVNVLPPAGDVNRPGTGQQVV